MGGQQVSLEHISLTKGNLDFFENYEAFKFIDDTIMLEILSLLSIGLFSYNAKMQVPSYIPPETAYIPPQNTKTKSSEHHKWLDW